MGGTYWTTVAQVTVTLLLAVTIQVQLLFRHAERWPRWYRATMAFVFILVLIGSWMTLDIALGNLRQPDSNQPWHDVVTRISIAALFGSNISAMMATLLLAGYAEFWVRIQTSPGRVKRDRKRTGKRFRKAEPTFQESARKLVELRVTRDELATQVKDDEMWTSHTQKRLSSRWRVRGAKRDKLTAQLIDRQDQVARLKPLLQQVDEGIKTREQNLDEYEQIKIDLLRLKQNEADAYERWGEELKTIYLRPARWDEDMPRNM